MAALSPYVRRPRVGDRLATSRYGLVTVEHVGEHGLALTIRDAIGRTWPIVRVPGGVWVRGA